MDEICDINKCTGCGLCSAVCSKNAISIITKGLHYYPIINHDRCNNCGLCSLKCIVNHPESLSASKECYAAWSKNPSEHFECSSAGVATIISRYFIHNGGYVVGCAWDENLVATYMMTNKISDLDKFKKSKYVHCFFPKEVYSAVLDKVKEGIEVLFIGVPCQSAALKRYVGKYSNRLYTCDLLCHGGCSPRLFKEHITRLQASVGKANNVTFRGGEYNCWFCLWGDNNKLLYCGGQYSDPYFYTFMRHTALRPSCYNCLFAHGERPSDLTLADFWGLDESFIKEHELYTGVNLVIPLTEKGYEILSKIRPYIELFKRDIQEAINGNETLQASTLMPKGYSLLQWAFPKFGLHKSLYLFDTTFQKIFIHSVLVSMLPMRVKRIIKKIIFRK